MNLILNARDAMPEGGTLEIATEFDTTSVTIRFTDNGDGVAQQRRQLFDRQRERPADLPDHDIAFLHTAFPQKKPQISQITQIYSERNL